MLKANELREARQMQYKNGGDVTLEVIQKLLADYAAKMEVPVAFRNEQVKSGGLFNSKTDDCLVVYHPEHAKDYFNFCILIQRQGAYAFVSVSEFGQSKQMDKAYRSELSKQGMKDYIHSKDSYATGQAIGKAIGGALGSIGKSKNKLEAEKMYYQCLEDVFIEVFK